jgi:hypothetical protein
MEVAMRTLTLALGTLMVTLLAAGHVDAGRSRSADHAAPEITAAPASIPMPTSAPAGVEVLLLVR